MADLVVKGTDQVLARLQKLATRIPTVVEQALYEEMQVEALESQRRTPVDTGALRASHRVSSASAGADISATITVGGPSAPYALQVHENLEAFHPVGQAKFLESTIDEARPHLAGRVARRIDLLRASR